MDKSLPAFDSSDSSIGKCPDCTVEVGTIFDGEDCTVHIRQIYTTQALAQEALTTYTAKAREAESDPCQISSYIQEVNGGFELNAEFVFSCQAEKVIFQFKTR